MATSKDLGATLTSERAAFGAWLDGFKNAEGQLEMPAEKVGEFHTRNDELVVKQTAYDNALIVEKAAAENALKLVPRGLIGDPEPTKGSGMAATKDAAVEAFQKAWTDQAGAIKSLADGARGALRMELPVDLKTLITTTDYAPTADRQRATGSALFFGNVEDLFPSGTTTSKSIDYYIQTTDTDNAAAVAQGSAATDSAFSWTLTTDPVETVQDWIPVTRESLDDNDLMQSMVTGLLAQRLQKKSSQIMLSGTGVTPIPTGVAVRTGVQTQAKGTDPAFDAIHKAITLVEVTGGSVADAICIHPTDWENIRLTRTVDGVYILGNPTESGPMTLWGLPVRKTIGVVAAGTAGTALVGAFGSMAMIINRRGVTLELSTEHSTYFTERKVAVMLSRRFVVADFRPNAFCKVTGL